MKVDTTHQNSTNKPMRAVYIKKMQGKCYGCKSDKHAKKDCPNTRDICNHCGKVRHRGPVCFTKYMGKPSTKSAGAAASSQEGALTSPVNKGKQTTAATSNALAIDSKAQADLLAKLMAQIQVQSEQLKALKSSF